MFAVLPARSQQVVVKDSIVGNVTWTADETYLVQGYLYVVDGAMLTIEPGTVIMGDKATKGSIIVERGGKIIAQGTAQRPIIMTSALPPGQRAAGDWGGLILCGKAPINQNNSLNGGTYPGGDAQIEGGPRTHYGGTDPHDNSGIVSYVRIEYPGIALAPNNEINGLTFGGVGDYTQIDHVQVSYSGDDSYEWFGGTVRCKYLIAYKGLDDDYDTDFGFSGAVQFGISERDPNIADISGSNGFESDNDNPPNFWNPRTRAVFTNMTIIGPQPDTSAAYNALFNRGAHLRRNTELCIYNSVVMGWPYGLLIDGQGTADAATGDTLQVKNDIWAGLRNGKDFTNASNTFNTSQWFSTASFANRAYVQPAEVKLADPFNQSSPNFRPLSASPATSGATFTNQNLQSQWFTPTNYVGAVSPTGPRWDSVWTEYNPQQTVYTPMAQLATNSVTFPNTAVSTIKDSSIALLKNIGYAPVVVTSVTVSGAQFSVQGLTTPFNLLRGDTKSIIVRYAPNDTNMHTGTLTIKTQDNQTFQISLSGKGVQPAPAFSVDYSVLDFALVRKGESVDKPVTISNTGTADLSLNGFTISGVNAANFSFVSGNTTGTIAPNTTRKVVVRFSPPDIGDYAASLKITHNAAGTPTTIPLKGKGIVVYGQDILQDSITTNVTLTNDRTWLVRGFVYIVGGGVLNIEPGTVIFGEKSTKGCIIAERGGKLIADGTIDQPIIFTSQYEPGNRNSGDWGGIILCGKAPINQNNTTNGGTFPGGDAQIEGGPRSHYGGTDPHDNSGTLRYVRIEFPGIPLAPNNEINGLTFGGVGDGTVIDHVQVSYSGDDSYEWFGGTVGVKHLIAYSGLDDEWDTDFGFSGKAQFCVSLRDPNIADISLSNGFESDNDNPPNYWNPRTRAIFCNMTVVGPQKDTSAPYNSLFGRGAHIRRNSLLNIYNSVVIGWPTGILFDGSGVTTGATTDSLHIRNCIWAGLRVGKGFTTNVSGFDPTAWYHTSSFANQDFIQPSEVMLADPFNLASPNFRPMSGSPAASGASFASPGLNDPFFEAVTYKGAFDPAAPRWDSVWTNYNPQNTVYAPNVNAPSGLNFAKTALTMQTDSTFAGVLSNSGTVVAKITDMKIVGSTDFEIAGPAVPFTVRARESKDIQLRFKPSAAGVQNGKLQITFATTEDPIEIDLSGEGIASGVTEENSPNGLKLYQNSPNPTNGKTTIAFELPKSEQAVLEVMDITGKQVAVLANGNVDAGRHEVEINTDTFANGVYVYRLTAGGESVTKSMVIVK